jgi:hypothetical protein
LDFAHATSTVLYVMCGIMAFAGVVALFGLEQGRQQDLDLEIAESPGVTRELAP